VAAEYSSSSSSSASPLVVGAAAMAIEIATMKQSDIQPLVKTLVQNLDVSFLSVLALDCDRSDFVAQCHHAVIGAYRQSSVAL